MRMQTRQGRQQVADFGDSMGPISQRCCGLRLLGTRVIVLGVTIRSLGQSGWRAWCASRRKWRCGGFVAMVAGIWCCCGCETVGEQATRSAVEWVGEGVGNLVSDGADSLTRERKCRVWMVANVLPMLPASSQMPWMLPEVQRTALFRQLDTRDCRDCVGFTNFVRAGLGTEVFAGRWFGHSNVVTLARFNTNGLGFVWVALDQRGYWFEHGAGTNVSSIPW